MNKTFSRLLSKWVWKQSNVIQITAQEKMCALVEQNENKIYCVSLEDEKHTWILICSTHVLYVFWKENHLNLRIFSLKMALLQFFANFKLLSYDTNHFTDQTEWIFGLLIHSLFDWQGFELQVKSSIFWASWLQKLYLLL